MMSVGSARPQHEDAAAHAPSAATASALARFGAALSLTCLLAVAVLMALIAFRLFDRMTMVGMQGVDTFEYWKYAEEILRGKVDFNFNRLSFYSLNALAMQWLGVNDYAMRAFIGAAAVLNIGLVYVLAYRVSANPVLALLVAGIYAFNPTILFYATNELPHIYGATFVLLAATCALPAIDPRTRPGLRLLLTGLVGFWLAAAVLTHEDLLFLALAFGVLLPLMSPRDHPLLSRQMLLLLMVSGSSFVLGFALGLAWPMLVIGVSPAKLVQDFFAVKTMIDQNTVVRTGTSFFRVTVPRLFENLTRDLLGPPLWVVTAVSLAAVPLAAAWFRSSRLKSALMLEAAALIYFLLFVAVGQVFLEGNYRRIFIPVIALTMVSAVCGGYLALKMLLARFAPGVFPTLIATLAMGGASGVVIAGYNTLVHAPLPTSVHRVLYDAVKGRVDQDRKVLLPACFPLEKEWVGIGSDVYLGRNAVSLYLAKNIEPFDAFLATHSIRYVLVPSIPTLRLMPLDEIKRVFSVFYGTELPLTVEMTIPGAPQTIFPNETRKQWSWEACLFENDVLRRMLLARGSLLVVSVPGVGDVYELPRTWPRT